MFVKNLIILQNLIIIFVYMKFNCKCFLRLPLELSEMILCERATIK